MVYHDPGLLKLEYQLEYLGKTTHDDCADSLECSFHGLDFPESLDYEWFAQEEAIKSQKFIRPEKLPTDFDWRVD